MAKPSIKWDYSYSNLGPTKKVAGTTFYKIQVGSEVKWLSRQGLNMVIKAKQAGVKLKTVRKAMSFYTASGTQKRLKIMRNRIKADLDDLLTAGLEGFEISGKQKGLLTMLKRAGLDDLAKEFSGLLDFMNEEELREFYSRNKVMLQKFFEDSDPYKSATSSDEEIEAASGRIRTNALKLRDKMLQIITQDMAVDDLKSRIARSGIDAKTAAVLMAYRKGHL